MVDQRRIDDQRWLDARAAAKHLGIQLRSLYAYVSRGQVRSVPGERGRGRLYAFADLERLRVRRDARSGHGPVAAGALRWGEPVLESSITAISVRGPAYRGRLAVDLADTNTPFENVAELLWTSLLSERPITWPRREGLGFDAGALAPIARALTPPIDRMPLLVQLAALADPERSDRRLEAFLGCGRRVIPLLAASLVTDLSAASLHEALSAGSVASILTRALGLGDTATTHFNRALVLLADHELNASSFTARVAASTDADAYACLAAALATLSGPKHGRASDEVARFVDEVGSPENARSAVRALRKKGGVPPGFGHPLYVGADPRAVPLIESARALLREPLTRSKPHERRAQTLLAVIQAAPDAEPNVDVGLAALVASLGAPASTGPGLFAVARSAGWLAHAIEQRAAGFLLRPRARYTGPPLERA
jgi:citrate synthase